MLLRYLRLVILSALVVLGMAYLIASWAVVAGPTGYAVTVHYLGPATIYLAVCFMIFLKHGRERVLMREVVRYRGIKIGVATADIALYVLFMLMVYFAFSGVLARAAGAGFFTVGGQSFDLYLRTVYGWYWLHALLAGMAIERIMSLVASASPTAGAPFALGFVAGVVWFLLPAVSEYLVQAKLMPQSFARVVTISPVHSMAWLDVLYRDREMSWGVESPWGLLFWPVSIFTIAFFWWRLERRLKRERI